MSRSVFTIIADIRRFEKLGGRDSFFGMKHIFEGVIKDCHKNKGYSFRGLNQYGNIIETEPLKETLNVCLNKYKFTEAEFKELSEWYMHRRSVDTIACSVLMDYYLPGIIKEQE